MPERARPLHSGPAVSSPINPDPVTTFGDDSLPPYVSNGLIGLRVMDVPLMPGIAILSGLSGEHPVERVESAARAPYPVAGDIGLGGIWLREVPHRVRLVDQRYDFGSGELATRFAFATDAVEAEIEVVLFCSRSNPTIVAQEVSVRVDAATDVTLRAIVDPGGIDGRRVHGEAPVAGGQAEMVDGVLCWEPAGGLSQVGVASATELRGTSEAERRVIAAGDASPLVTEYAFRARRGRRYALRQVVSLVPSVVHHQPDRQAVRLAAQAADVGFDELRRRNRAAWAELWAGRILLDGPDPRWQELTDAGLYYLLASTHPASPSSTSIFGLAQWTDYHYYYGHVMWDIETFSVPPLSLLAPAAAASLLGFRSRTLPAARMNARIHGRAGVQFPWEAGASRGEEAAPGPGRAAWHEEHVSLDVAWAFAHHANATGDAAFLAGAAWPVLAGVAAWLVSRVLRTDRGYELRDVMGIAERAEPADNEAFTAMAATVVLRAAAATAERLGHEVPAAWRIVADDLVVPTDSSGRWVVAHDGWRPNEEKGATPAPLAGLFPFWYELSPEVERATLRRFLDLADGYVGSPMLSALYGVWACWAGDRELAARLLESGYADLHAGRFTQQLEQVPSLEPDKPRAGPFFANIGGYLSGLLFGLPAIRVGPGDPRGWPQRPVVLPVGWERIRVERAWIHGRPATIEAQHGADRARIDLHGDPPDGAPIRMS